MQETNTNKTETPGFNSSKPMKQVVSTEVKQSVLALRRKHSIREVAAMTGLPLGTVKTLCSRSGEFRDNAVLRSVCTLPEPQLSSSNVLVMSNDLPPQSVVTGDSEIDAVLWLREVIKTGNPDLIAKAMQAAERIKTPLSELGKRYTQHLMAKNPGNFSMAFKSFGFDDLNGLAKKVIDNANKQQEAKLRFGDSLFNETLAECFCIEALLNVGTKRDKWGCIPSELIDLSFNAMPKMLPHTLGDCVYELIYWDKIYWLRRAVNSDYMDDLREVSARKDFLRRQLACIRPRSKAESLEVFHYLTKNSDGFDRNESDSIFLNLIA